MSVKKEAYPEVSTELENPFQEKEALSDVALVVEGKKLHVHRTLLALYSPVFERMFFSEFVEKDCPEIELPGKNYDDCVQFLLQLYPVHSSQPITDDKLLAVQLLAEEYQVAHILCKCQNYINDQIAVKSSSLTTNQLLLYLWMCDRSRFKEEKDELVNLVKAKSFRDIAGSKFYDSVDAHLMRNVMYKCLEIASSKNYRYYPFVHCVFCHGKKEELRNQKQKWEMRQKEAEAEINRLRYKLKCMHKSSLVNCTGSSLASRLPVKSAMFSLFACFLVYVCWSILFIPRI